MPSWLAGFLSTHSMSPTFSFFLSLWLKKRGQNPELQGIKWLVHVELPSGQGVHPQQLRPAALASLGGFFAHAEAQAEAPGHSERQWKKYQSFFFGGWGSDINWCDREFGNIWKWPNAILIKQNVDHMKQSWLILWGWYSSLLNGIWKSPGPKPVKIRAVYLHTRTEVCMYISDNIAAIAIHSP